MGQLSKCLLVYTDDILVFLKICVCSWLEITKKYQKRYLSGKSGPLKQHGTWDFSPLSAILAYLSTGKPPAYGHIAKIPIMEPMKKYFLFERE